MSCSSGFHDDANVISITASYRLNDYFLSSTIACHSNSCASW